MAQEVTNMPRNFVESAATPIKWPRLNFKDQYSRKVCEYVVEITLTKMRAHPPQP